jgi:hypothetical protein
MKDAAERFGEVLQEFSVDERKLLKAHLQLLLPHPLELEWGVAGDTILSAIRRSSDLTKRGVRGIIAEAVFESDVLPALEAKGWEPASIPADLSYDVKIRRADKSVTIQIKLQRLEKGAPKLYYPKHYSQETLYVVEVQKTRSGQKASEATDGEAGGVSKSARSAKVQTRPYHFGDFDILAVNMHPSSGNWNDFRYTVSSWLLPRRDRKSKHLIEIFQPVATSANDVWTDDIETCLEWLEQGVERKVLTELLHVPKGKRKAKKAGAKTVRKLRTKQISLDM